jgi:hypothetical protein
VRSIIVDCLLESDADICEFLNHTSMFWVSVHAKGEMTKVPRTVMAAFDAFAMFEEILRRTKYSVSLITNYITSCQPCLLQFFVMYVSQNATIRPFHHKALTDLMYSLMFTFMHCMKSRFAKACSMGFSSSITNISERDNVLSLLRSILEEIRAAHLAQELLFNPMPLVKCIQKVISMYQKDSLFAGREVDL